MIVNKFTFQIGDVIRETNNNKFHVISEIRENCVICGDKSFKYNEIQPVDLTRELLELNGWRICGNKLMPPTRLHYEFVDNGCLLWRITPINYTMWYFEKTPKVTFRYVHEYQHFVAFRLNAMNDYTTHIEFKFQ